MIKIEIHKRHTGTILSYEREDGTGIGSIFLHKEEEYLVPIFKDCIDECNRKTKEVSGDTIEVTTVTGRA